MMERREVGATRHAGHGLPSQARNTRDADEIARTHRDSIETIGRHFYVAEIVSEWRSGLTPDLYRRAMEHGEVFFIAVDEHDRVLGFSTHRVDGSQHGTAVYVRGSAARRGVGSACTGWQKPAR